MYIHIYIYIYIYESTYIYIYIYIYIGAVGPEGGDGSEGRLRLGAAQPDPAPLRPVRL